MTQTTALIKVLKKSLKDHQMTYADIAKQLEMSEANIKRLFASRRFSLERLETICQLMDMELSDLFQLYEASRQRISQLTEEQEIELVADEKLLLVAVCVRNQHCFADIIQHYEISQTECIRYLAKLDKLKIIDLLPKNRIKLRIDDGFSWLKNGPIERYFETQIQSQFLQSHFNASTEKRKFLFGLLGESSVHILQQKIAHLANEFSELHQQDASLPLEKRRNFGFLLAIRPWNLPAFAAMKKHHWPK
ncbi:MAG: helix-turn-helix transcriptional regulator [Methylococcales bacterium]|jgi:DNA-binding Xre family transcriptional regulator|nr:helix-turn-helix transcriptional regulator [Methylococcales bacterium]